MSMFAIKNLVAQAAVTVEPWTISREIPAGVRGSKEAFSKWVKTPTTDGCHFSAMEGLDPNCRISENDDNPVVAIHGIVVDYDAPATVADLLKLKTKAPVEFLPNWASLTFSGNARLVWLFSRPIPVASNQHAERFMKEVYKRLKLKKFMAGLDEDALYKVSQYYEVGSDWTKLSDAMIPENFLWQWLYEAGRNFRFDDTKYRIPIDRIAEEVHKQYPGRWTGDFDIGARGIRFWDPAADNPTAAVVHEDGMMCFTGPSAFVSWKSILGTKFVEQFEAERTGEIMRGIVVTRDEKYWRQLDNGEWAEESENFLGRYLRANFTISDAKTRREPVSELERILVEIAENKRVDRALPFVHYKPGVIRYDGRLYLNVCNTQCMQPAPEGSVQHWGHNFPWAGSFLLNYFADPQETQLHFFLSWWKRFYENGLRHTPKQGQAIVIAGPTGCGKNFLSHAFVGASVGGFSPAEAFLVEGNQFNGEILKRPVMAIDDVTMFSKSVSKSKRNMFSALLKKLTANREMDYNEKYKMSGKVDWLGRAIVTCNLDPDSIEAIPSMEINNKDKVSLFLANPEFAALPGHDEQAKIMARELPYLLRWLLDWKYPAYCVSGAGRYGVNSYHHPELLDASVRSGQSYSFLELVKVFLDNWKVGHPNDGKWEGTATQLASDMAQCEPVRALASRYSTNQIGSYLGHLKTHGYQIERTKSHGQWIWTIPYDVHVNVLETFQTPPVNLTEDDIEDPIVDKDLPETTSEKETQKKEGAE